MAVWQFHGINASLHVGPATMQAIGAATAMSLFVMALLALAIIDLDTMLLPDAITQPLIWLGLMAAAMGCGRVPLNVALWGAVVGYLSLWIISEGFHSLSGKDGMGQGDLKLFAAIGAWLGYAGLPFIAMVASVLSVLVTLLMALREPAQLKRPRAFGPFLVVVAVLAPSVRFAF